jgi:hypothetical protein
MPSKKTKKKARKTTAHQQKANDTSNKQDGLPSDLSVAGDNPDKGDEEDEDMGDPPPTPTAGTGWQTSSGPLNHRYHSQVHQ